MFTAADVEAAIRPVHDRHAPQARLVCIEQTTNLGGGRVWPQDRVREVLAVARERGLHAHLDGARLLNAVVASGVPASEWTAGFDTAWIDFSKGLGAPVGAAIAGDAETIERAFRLKHRLGGAMRQAGIVAAAGLYALERHVDRLADDHRRARRLAEGLAALPGVEIDPQAVETNIVVFDVPDAAAVARRMAEQGVRVGALGPQRMRAVTHLDIDDAGIDRALAAAHLALGSPGTVSDQ